MERISYENIGQAMRRIRNSRGWTQKEIAERIGVERSVYAKYESGTVRPNIEYLETFAKTFNIGYEEMLKKISIAVPDTSALLENTGLIEMLLEDFDKVVIFDTVMAELSFRKSQKQKPNDRKTGRDAWLVMSKINNLTKAYPKRLLKYDNSDVRIPEYVKNNQNLINDYKLMGAARKLERDGSGEVIIIHNDIDFSIYGGKHKRINEYLSNRGEFRDFQSLSYIAEEFENIEKCKSLIGSVDLNAYLSDGTTLLINTIRCNDIERIEKRDGRRVSDKKILEKIQFLLENGADPNKNDNWKYCLPPISHCIQIREKYGFDAFMILLKFGCDFNKASRNEKSADCFKDRRLNEGNTPLMIACWHGKTGFVHILCEQKGISLNQQDSNGYTALIKCAVQRSLLIKKGKKHEVYDKLFEYLSSLSGVDPLISDRNGFTAEDWLKQGDRLQGEKNK